MIIITVETQKLIFLLLFFNNNNNGRPFIIIIIVANNDNNNNNNNNNNKVEKYQDLARELGKLWRTSVTVIPIVIGALGAVARLDEYMSMLEIERNEVDRVQFSALLGSARILRKVLDISA